jgi:serine/alanine adding enzyme
VTPDFSGSHARVGEFTAAGWPRLGATPLSVSVATEHDSRLWDAFVLSHPRAFGYHEWAWRGVFERSFGHSTVYLIARDRGPVVGVLPLVRIRSLLFGRSITSLPFVNYGGVLAASAQAANVLVDEAVAIASEEKCRHVELRHIERQFPGEPCKQHKVAMQLRLVTGMWDVVDRKVRNQVRKAEKSNLTVERGGNELLTAFYQVFARNMRDLGTPVYARRFFSEVMRAFPDRTRIIVVRREGEPIAAGLFYRTGTRMEVPWASSVREFNHLCPNHLMYWHAIESAIADGCDLFDFGRSTPDEGTFKFKAQWGAVPTPMSWEYPFLQDGVLPDQSPKNPKFRTAIDAWRRLPLWVANGVGPWVVKNIP